MKQGTDRWLWRATAIENDSELADDAEGYSIRIDSAAHAVGDCGKRRIELRETAQSSASSFTSEPLQRLVARARRVALGRRPRYQPAAVLAERRAIRSRMIQAARALGLGPP